MPSGTRGKRQGLLGVASRIGDAMVLQRPHHRKLANIRRLIFCRACGDLGECLTLDDDDRPTILCLDCFREMVLGHLPPLSLLSNAPRHWRARLIRKSLEEPN